MQRFASRFWHSPANPTLAGVIFGIISALGYTAANIYLRRSIASDPAWVSCIKAVPTAIAAGVLVMGRLRRGEATWPSAKVMGALIGIGLLAQLGGNVTYQWTLGVIGLSMVVPLCTGAMIVGAAIMGRIWLSEAVTPRSILAMALVIAAIIVLSQAAGTASASAALPEPPIDAAWWVTLGVLGACLAGVAYAMLNVAIRRTTTRDVPLSTTLFLVSSSGVVSLLLLTLWRIGPSGILQTPPAALQDFIAAGIFNAIAFFSLSKSLHLLPVAKVNLLNASQVAMSALAGVLFFSEPFTVWLAIGIALTIAGMVLMRRRARPIADADSPTARGVAS